MRDTLLVIPTYCEIQTLPGLLKRVRAENLDVDVLVVDDNSEDGTGRWAESFSSQNSWLNVHHRPEKSGLASAYVEGFRIGMARGYKYLGQMDADGSHLPSQWNRLAARIRMPDQPAGVIGSRWVSGGAVPGWSMRRATLSKAGNHYIRWALGMSIADATAGYRLYRAGDLARCEVLNKITSRGYGFQAEMTYRLIGLGQQLVEVPVTFTDRAAGTSKLSPDIIIEELHQITGWGLARLIHKLPAASP